MESTMKKTNAKRLLAFLMAFVLTFGILASSIASVVYAADEPTFSDVQADHWAYAYIEDLAGQDIISGYGDGTFKPQNNLKRSQAAKMIVLASGMDYEGKTSGFADVTAGSEEDQFIGALKEAGIVSGYEGNQFKPNDVVKRSQIAKMLTEAFDLVKGDVEVPAFPDLTNDEATNDYINVLASNGIVKGKDNGNFEPYAATTRAQFSKMVSEAMNVAEGQKTDLKVEKVSAVNAKTIEVTFNKAVEDTSKATIELLRGTFKQNFTTKWADDKTSVQLIGANNFQAADYTVNITGLTSEALTGTVKIEAQKVASIEILSDVAVLSKDTATGVIVDTDTDKTTATVGYIVKDQYGTDITKTTQLTTNSDSTVAASNGTVTLSGLNGKKVGDLVPVVLVHAQSGTTATATLKLSAASTVADIAVDGVYNAKGEKVELKDNTKAKDVFLVVDLKDQYGNAIKPVAADASGKTGVIVTNTNPLVTKLPNDKVTTASINNKLEFVVKFEELDATNQFKGGSAGLLFISTMNGQTFNYTLNIAETKTTDAVSISQPEFAIVGEDVLLPITVMDKEGNVITDRDLLSNATKGIKVNGNTADKTKLSVKDGQVYYNLGKPAGAADSYTTATVTTSTNKIATVTYKITATAKPVAVRGFKTPLVVKAGDKKTVAFADVNVEDQYGRTMKELPSSFAVVVEPITDDTKAVTVNNANVITAGANNGTATVTIKLTDSNITATDKTVPNSAVEQQVRVTDGKEYTDYEIATIGKVQAGTDKAFTVNGILNDGKVALDPSEYTATVSGGFNTEGKEAKADDGKITVNTAAITDGTKDPADTEFTLKVTINATGKVLEQKFIVSPKVATTQEFFFTTATTDAYKDAKAITEATLQSGQAIGSLMSTDDTPKTVNVATVDQYGTKAVVTLTADSVTIIPEKISDVTITGNGTANAKVSLAEGVEKATVTMTVKIGDATKDIKVTVVPAS